MNYRCFYKHLLFLILIVIIYLSGCLGKIETYQQQICLDLTHYSTTSIPSCTTQKNCYNKISNLKIPQNIPINLENKINKYKNYIASSTYYFNKSKKELDNINKFCNNPKLEDTKDILDNVNHLFYYLHNTFVYLDKSTKESVEIIKDYTIFYEDQDINYIAEEEIYSDFIKLNNNLNELKDKDTGAQTYLGEVKNHSKILNELAQSFGFNESYVSKVNYIDLYSYYYKFTDIIQSENHIPTFNLSNSFIIKKISNLEDFKKLNINLQRNDNYNIYLFFDKLIGTNNSAFTKFSQLNNIIYKNNNEIYTEIKELEDFCFKNYNYLNDKEKGDLLFINNEYKYNKLSFGKYLYNLKMIKNKLEENIYQDQKLKKEQEDIIQKCDSFIKLDLIKGNIFLENYANNYKNEENYEEKIKICNDINYFLNIEDNKCYILLTILLNENIEEVKEYEYLKLEEANSFDCKAILTNIDYSLSNNIKILELKKEIKEIEYELENYYIIKSSINNNLELDLLEYEKMKNEKNIELIIEIDGKIKQLKEIKNKIQKENKNLIIDLLEKDLTIIYKENKYYLVFYNPIYDLENISITNKFKEIESLTNSLKTTKNTLNIHHLQKGNNQYEVNYNNKQKIKTNIVELRLNLSLIELIITNSVEGIITKQYVGKINLLNQDLAKYNPKTKEISYTTKKTNKILYFKDIIEEEIKNTKIQELDNNKFIIQEDLIIKNIFEEKIDDYLYLKQKEDDEEIIIKKNKINIDYKILNDQIAIPINLSSYDKETYTIYTLKTKELIYNELENFTNTIIQLKYSRFKNIQDNINELIKDNDLEEKIYSVNNYNLEDIKKMYLLKEEINRIKNEEDYLAIREEEFIDLYNKINLDKDYLDTYNQRKLDNLYEERLEDVSQKIEGLKILKQKIEDQKYEDNINKNTDHLQEIDELKEKINKYDITDSSIIKELENLTLEDKNIDEKLKNVENNISENLKTKCENIYQKLEGYNELIFEEINELIKTSQKQFEEYDLIEYHLSKIYPEINILDLDRIVKKIDFLNTQKLNNEKEDFYKYYNQENYEIAINKIPQTTFNRLEDINKEKTIIIKFLNKYKNELEEIIDTTDNTDLKNELKNKYLEEKYLPGIYIFKTNYNENKNNNFKINNFSQNITLLSLIFVFILIYFFYNNNNKKRRIDYSEKKKKILRKY